METLPLLFSFLNQPKNYSRRVLKQSQQNVTAPWVPSLSCEIPFASTMIAALTFMLIKHLLGYVSDEKLQNLMEEGGGTPPCR